MKQKPTKIDPPSELEYLREENKRMRVLIKELQRQVLSLQTRLSDIRYGGNIF